MTESEWRLRLVRQAESWQGRHESDGSHRLIIDVYNRISPLPRGYAMRYTDPWCAAFVSAAGAAAGLGSVILPECACEPMIARYRAAGRFEEADEAVPRPGDLIFYDWQDSGAGDCRGEPDHVGIVTAVEGDRLTVIEGNRSDRVAERRLLRNAGCIRGYGRPDYGAEAPAEPAATLSDDAPLPSLALPTLQRGSRGESVRAAQLMLIGRGYRCGPCGADGDFGPGTYGGVLSFQRGRRLRPDGVIGPETWRALLGLGADA